MKKLKTFTEFLNESELAEVELTYKLEGNDGYCELSEDIENEFIGLGFDIAEITYTTDKILVKLNDSSQLNEFTKVMIFHYFDVCEDEDTGEAATITITEVKVI